MRKLRIAQLQADIACNEKLEPRIKQIAADVEEKGPAEFSMITERFKTNPSPEAPPSNAPKQPTYDQMTLGLMLQVWDNVKKDGIAGDDPRLKDALVAGLRKHLALMDEHQAKLKHELEVEEAEQHKKITSEDLHDGFESHVRLPAVSLCKRVCANTDRTVSMSHRYPRHRPSRARSPHHTPRRRRRPKSKC